MKFGQVDFLLPRTAVKNQLLKNSISLFLLLKIVYCRGKKNHWCKAGLSIFCNTENHIPCQRNTKSAFSMNYANYYILCKCTYISQANIASASYLESTYFFLPFRIRNVSGKQKCATVASASVKNCGTLN